MRRNSRLVAVVAALLVAMTALFAVAPQASAQDLDEIVAELENQGYYIEVGGEATDSEMRQLLDQAANTGDVWYFVVLSGPADEGFAADVREFVRPSGNVLVHAIDEDSEGFFYQVDLASGSSTTIEEDSLVAFDGDWGSPADYFSDVVSDYTQLTSQSSTNSSGSTSSGSSSSGSSSSGSSSSDSGGGFPWILLAIPVVLVGGIWFMSRRKKKKEAEEDLGRAQKIRAELQTEIDELANDVLVLSSPVDLSENEQAIDFYREATDTYLTISDEIPDMSELEGASLKELANIGTRVTHARWQMDATEALLDGEPIPEKPKVTPPPAPKLPPQERAQHREQQRRRMPQRQPRARVPYSRSNARSTRTRSGGGLLDILIAGGSMMGSGRRSGGGMFGGGGGMFGGGSPRSLTISQLSIPELADPQPAAPSHAVTASRWRRLWQPKRLAIIRPKPQSYFFESFVKSVIEPQLVISIEKSLKQPAFNHQASPSLSTQNRHGFVSESARSQHRLTVNRAAAQLWLAPAT